MVLNKLKDILFMLLGYLPVWTILGWITDNLEERAKKTVDNNFDDMLVGMLKAILGVVEDNKDKLFNGEEIKKLVK